MPLPRLPDDVLILIIKEVSIWCGLTDYQTLGSLSSVSKRLRGITLPFLWGGEMILWPSSRWSHVLSALMTTAVDNGPYGPDGLGSFVRVLRLRSYQSGLLTDKEIIMSARHMARNFGHQQFGLSLRLNEVLDTISPSLQRLTLQHVPYVRSLSLTTSFFKVREVGERMSQPLEDLTELDIQYDDGILSLSVILMGLSTHLPPMPRLDYLHLPRCPEGHGAALSSTDDRNSLNAVLRTIKTLRLDLHGKEEFEALNEVVALATPDALEIQYSHRWTRYHEAVPQPYRNRIRYIAVDHDTRQENRMWSSLMRIDALESFECGLVVAELSHLLNALPTGIRSLGFKDLLHSLDGPNRSEALDFEAACQTFASTLPALLSEAVWRLSALVEVALPRLIAELVAAKRVVALDTAFWNLHCTCEQLGIKLSIAKHKMTFADLVIELRRDIETKGFLPPSDATPQWVRKGIQEARQEVPPPPQGFFFGQQ